jgi:hypothetical protein
MALETQREDLSRRLLFLRDRELRQERPRDGRPVYQPLLNDHQPMAPAYPAYLHRRAQVPEPPPYLPEEFEEARSPPRRLFNFQQHVARARANPAGDAFGPIPQGVAPAQLHRPAAQAPARDRWLGLGGGFFGLGAAPGQERAAPGPHLPRFPEPDFFEVPVPLPLYRHGVDLTATGLAHGAAYPIECTVCGDDLKGLNFATLVCGHPYCDDCIQQLFTVSFKDEQLFPPRCCFGLISIASVKAFLTPEIESEFAAKSKEYGTKNRTYCANRQCGVFLLPLAAATSVECSACETFTCIACKSQQHDGECPKDEGTDQLEALVKKEGWKRCPHCNRVIELQDGCNHI